MIGKYISLVKKIIVGLFLVYMLSVIFWSCGLLISKEGSVSIELNADIAVDEDTIIVNAELLNNSDEAVNNIELSVYEPSGYYGLSEGSFNISHKESLDSCDSLCFSTQFKINDTNCTNNVLIAKKFNKLVVCIKLLIYLVLVSLVVFVFYRYRIKLLLLLLLFISFIYSRDLYLYTKGTQDSTVIHSIEKTLWVQDKRGERVGLLVKATYTDDKFINFIDDNNNLIPDCYEQMDFLKDTDGDGLVDYVEVCMLGTSPFMIDTYGTRLGDGGCDTDKDGLSNLLELQLGSNPVKKDTDYDGLDDNREVELGTDCLAYDTDKDGLSDGLEVLRD